MSDNPLIAAPPGANLLRPASPPLVVPPRPQLLLPPQVDRQAGLEHMISQRIPTDAEFREGGSATGVPLAHRRGDLHLELGHMPVADRGARQLGAASILRAMPDLQLADERDDNTVIAKALERMADNQHWVYDHIDPAVREVGSHWYEGAHVLTRDLTGPAVPHPATAGMAARLSPGWDWNHNAEMLPRILRTHLAHGYTEETPNGMAHRRMLEIAEGFAEAQKRDGPKALLQAAIEEMRRIPYEAFGQDLASDHTRALWIIAHDTMRAQEHPEHAYVPLIHPYGVKLGWALKPNEADIDTLKWQSTPNVARAINILRNPTLENISRMLGDDGHKIRSFYNDMIAPHHPQGLVTGDIHHIAISHFLPIGISHPYAERGAGSPKNGATGSNGLYALYQEATRELARRLSQTGYSPRAIQSIIWDGGRMLFPAADKRSETFLNVIDTIMRNSPDARKARDAIGKYALGPQYPRIPIPYWHRSAAGLYG